MTFGSNTVREGERACVWSRDGSARLVDGPRRLFLCLQRLEVLPKHSAGNVEYLEVRRRDGTVIILPGPAARFFDPVEDISVHVREARLIDASEALVVYRHTANKVGEPHVERRVVLGPARFIPSADEWVHEFEWSGVPQDGSKTTYQPKALRFTKLRVIPASAYHNVSEVRTNDDTLITVKLMLFFELRDVEKMLDATNDPIGDFINAASADVIAFCAGVSYETFLNETHRLNELDTFAQLCVRAQHIGYDITKVVFRGFQAGAKLQAMHDNAIQERTRLRLLEETQAQEQRQADAALAAETRRAAQQAELETGQAQQRAQLSMVSVKAQLAERRLQDEAEIERQARAAEQRLAEQQAHSAELLATMREMKAMGVDLTKVLVSQHEAPDKVIKLDTGAAPAAEGKKSLLSAIQLNL